MASKPPPERKKPAPFQKGRPLDFNSFPSAPRVKAAPVVSPEEQAIPPSQGKVPVTVSAPQPAIEIASGPIQVRPKDRDELVLRWSTVIDRVDYFAVLKLPRPPSPDQGPTDSEVRKAFHRFALAFHPDHYRNAAEDVRAATARVYNVGTEAYRVLLDPMLTQRYLRLLSEGTLRMSPEQLEQTKMRLTSGKETIHDLVKSAGARPFALRADELVASGDLKQARLQLQLAIMREPANARLADRMRELDAAIAAPRKGTA
jgi:hypothetical protein